jgi:hypothetical protein
MHTPIEVETLRFECGLLLLDQHEALFRLGANAETNRSHRFNLGSILLDGPNAPLDLHVEGRRHRKFCEFGL